MLVKLSGNHGDIGYQHGRELAAKIHQAVEFYLRLFVLPGSDIEKMAQGFQRVIQQQAPQYIDELEAIAEGAGIPPWQIYALNARSEILAIVAAQAPSECTALYFAESKTLGQNWDWSEQLEPLMAVLQIKQDDGRQLLTLTEPGMLAKTGLNDQGVGVCLNILQAPIKDFGLPVHVCLRLGLDSGAFSEAHQALLTVNQGKASHILLADAEGQGVGLEYDDAGVHALVPEQDVLIHSNHYLMHQRHDSLMPTTHERLASARERTSLMNEKSLSAMSELLLDNSSGPGAAFQTYQYYEALNRFTEFGAVGTVMTVLMDLPARSMKVQAAKASTFNEYGL